jgi:hypothetical protein
MAVSFMKASRPNKRIEFQHRDFEIMKGLFESRIMSSRHMEDIYFEGKREATKKRLQKLKAVRVISEKRPKLYEPGVLSLTKKGFKLLKEEGQLAEYPHITDAQFGRRASVSALTIRHELAVMDVKAAFVRTARESEQLRLIEFSTWPILNQFKVKQRGKLKETVVKPDGLIRIHEQTEDGLYEHSYFVEVDRGTETLDTLFQKAICYSLYYRSGGFAVRNKALPSEFKEYPFRVIFTFLSKGRMNNFRNHLKAQGVIGMRQFVMLLFSSTDKDGAGKFKKLLAIK